MATQRLIVGEQSMLEIFKSRGIESVSFLRCRCGCSPASYFAAGPAEEGVMVMIGLLFDAADQEDGKYKYASIFRGEPENPDSLSFKSTYVRTEKQAEKFGADPLVKSISTAMTPSPDEWLKGLLLKSLKQ